MNAVRVGAGAVATFLVASSLMLSSPRTLPAQTEVEPLSLPDLIAHVEPAVVRIDVKTAKGSGVGSGFLVGQRGIVITNHHVIAGAKEATVTFEDGATAAVEGTYAMDSGKDIAVLLIDKKLRGTYDIIPFARGLPRKGEAVVAFGAPKGLSFSASEGIVSAIRAGRELEEFGGKLPGTWIQTTAPISPGNSGGPLVNRQGELVAMNTMTLVAAQNLNFAISAVDIQSFFDNSIHNEVVPLESGAALELKPVVAVGPEITRELAPDKVSPEAVAAFAQRGQAARTDAVKRLDADLAKRREQMKAFKAGTINKRLNAEQMGENRFVLSQVKGRTVVVYPDDDSKRETIAKVEQAVTKLDGIIKQVRDPKEGLASFLTLAGPELAPNKVGDIGFLEELEVVQIAGADEFHTYLGDRRVAVRGHSTEGFAKGSQVSGGVMYVCAVEHYETVAGGTNSVLVIRPFPSELLKSMLAKLPATDAKTAAKPAASPPVPGADGIARVWKDASGKFSIEARLVGNTADGKVKLQKLDGTTIEVAIAILSPSDRAFLRTARPAEKEAAQPAERNPASATP